MKTTFLWCTWIHVNISEAYPRSLFPHI